jgi:hypothetical protein
MRSATYRGGVQVRTGPIRRRKAMFEWYDLRMIELYPEDDPVDGVPAAPPGVIGEPREEVPEETLLPEETSAALNDGDRD